jgi:hypothetical protein
MAYEYTRESFLWESECTLIKPTAVQNEDGVREIDLSNRCTVFCRVGSVYMKEAYAAMQAGIQAAWKFTVNLGDYDGETVIEYDGEMYVVYRTFVDGDDIELLARKDLGTWESELSLSAS